MTCPKCNSSCDRIEVDIGVGLQYGPWECNNCGWSQSEEIPWLSLMDPWPQEEKES